MRDRRKDQKSEGEKRSGCTKKGCCLVVLVRLRLQKVEIPCDSMAGGLSTATREPHADWLRRALAVLLGSTWICWSLLAPGTLL